MIRLHLHRYSRWRTVSVQFTNDVGAAWRQDTQQRHCTTCGKLQVRRP